MSNEEVAAICNIELIPVMLNKTHVWWVGHMVRMGNIGLPRKILFGGLVKVRVRGLGRPK